MAISLPQEKEAKTMRIYNINIRFWDNRIWYRPSLHAKAASPEDAVLSNLPPFSQIVTRSEVQRRSYAKPNGEANTAAAVLCCKM
jgi:hypothetical protein